MTDPENDLPEPLRQAVDRLRAAVPDEASIQRALARAEELERLMFRRFLRRCAVGSAAAVLLLSAVAWLAWPRTTLAQVAKAIQEQTWIRARANVPGGGQFESWMAPKLGISAKKTTMPNEFVALFDDEKANVTAEYSSRSNTIRRTSPRTDAMKDKDDILRAFSAMARGEDKLESPFPHLEVLGQEKRTVTDGGKKWVEYDLTLRRKGQVNAEPAHVVFRVDPATNLPASMTLTSKAEGVVRFDIDYPKEGPKSIYDLGAPRDAKVEERKNDRP